MAIPDIPGVDARDAPLPDIGRREDAGPLETQNRSNDDRSAVVEAEQRSSRPKWNFSRVMWCTGWIFCCPLFACLYAMREKPVDKEDMKEDPCLPCWA